MDFKWVISEEERDRHDALFYSQNPQDRNLSGEKARSLFIRSKLPLPELSKIWKLADISRNNMLDIAEFAVAMHLIQSRLKGKDIPEKLPETLAPVHLPSVNVPTLSQEEREAYGRVFLWKNDSKMGCIDAERACSILVGSGLSEDTLARIWNLSDIDRDGKLSQDELFVALHLTRFCKQGNSIEGSVDVRPVLSQQVSEDCYNTKKLRLAEVQTEKRKLLSQKEKLCHEIAGGLDDKSIAQKVQDELDQVERQIYVLEKDENELRRSLQQLKDKSKRESFKPFDRSFLLKRQRTGEDIFRGASRLHKARPSDEKDVEIQKLWKEDGDLRDFGASISEDLTTPDVSPTKGKEQSERAVIELTQTEAESLITLAMSSTTSSAINGNTDEVKTKGLHSVDTENNNNNGSFDNCGTEPTKEEDAIHISSHKDKETKLDEVVSENKNYLFMNGSSPNSPPHPETSENLHSDSNMLIDIEPSESTVKGEFLYENRTDDEKSTSLLTLATIDSHTDHSTSDGKEESSHGSDERFTEVASETSPNTSGVLMEGSVQVSTSATAQSSAVSTMDGLSVKLGGGEDSFGSGTREAQPPLSPSAMTQEELIPLILEEKRRKEEERTKQRELDEELRRKAREESQKRDAETRSNVEQRKAMFAEERRKLEHQTSLAQEGEERKKAPLSRSEAGRIIERELEEQRLREELTRMEIEKIKEKEKAELEKQKLKHAQKEEHPSAFQGTDLIQTPIFYEQGDNVDGTDFQGMRISKKRGSIVDLFEGDVEFEPIKRPVENPPVAEPVKIASQPQKQPQPQPQPQPLAQPHVQPIIRRTKDGGKSGLNRNPENRKSIVELEIERQREREEETRKEAEYARRIQAKRQGNENGLDKIREETKAKEKRDSAIKPPSVQKKTEKFEKKSEELKAKEHRPKQMSEGSGPARKNSGPQTQIDVEVAQQSKEETVVASSPPEVEVDAVQRTENGIERSAKEFETEADRKRREEKELFRQMQEEERRRREAQRLDLERIRREVDQKEAEEMMRVKLEKEEERKKQRELELRMAEQREKDNAEKQTRALHDRESRKASFAAHKVILEQRVLKALEESKQESTLPKRRATSFDRPAEFSAQDDTIGSETNGELSSGGVKLRKANFEKTGTRKDSKEEMRKNRYSLNLESTRRGMNLPEHAPLRGGAHTGSMKERVPSQTADDVLFKEWQAQDVTCRSKSSNEGKLSKAKSLGDLSLKKGGKTDDLTSHPVFSKVSANHDKTDSVDGGLPSFSDSRIQKELEEQRMREAVVKQEVTEREKRHRLEEEKKKTSEQPAGKKEMSLRDIRRNPLPNKIQVKKPHQSSNRNSLTQSMAAQWETMLHSALDGSEAKDKTDKRKSMIELEKEEERRREEELQKERERFLLERKQKEEENKFLLQRKLEQENERKRKEKEEKEKRQQRTTAMKSLFEKMGDK